MEPAEAITMLVANAHAEEIKLATISMRGFYPGCRVEAVYSAEEALEWVTRRDWYVILLDEQLPHRAELDLLSELRARAPHSIIIIQTERLEVRTASQIMRTGADCYLFKKSPAFPTELPIVVSTLLEKRDLRTQLDLAQSRHLRLIETIPDIVFELDSEGKFEFISPSTDSLLGYSHQELIGTHCAVLLDFDEPQETSYQLHERRTGSRATQNAKVRLKGKNAETVMVEISASGLYNRQQKFLGTVGLFRRLAPQEQLKDQPIEEQAPDIAPRQQPAPITHIKDLQDLSYPDRRRNPRIDIQIAARLNMNGEESGATALNISLSGMYFAVDKMIPVGEDQAIQLGLTSEANVLDIRGRVRAIREATHRRAGPQGTPAMGLAVDFPTLGAIESQVLASILDELRERPALIKLTAFLGTHDTGNLLLEVNPLVTDTVELTAIRPSPSEPIERPPLERRLSARVNLALVVQLQRSEIPSDFFLDAVLTVNLSMGGMCLRVRAQEDLVGRRFLLRLPSADSLPSQSVHAPAMTSHFTVTGQVIWTAPAQTELADLRADSRPTTFRAGIRFVFLNDEGYRNTAELLGRFLVSPLPFEEPGEQNSIVSMLLECRNARGRRIAVYHDYPRQELLSAFPVVIISPGYGETKRDYVALAYYFASNGFQVLRYDHTNHVGESDGDNTPWTLSNMSLDLRALLDFAEHNWPASPITVVATSLAGRVALKTVTQESRIKLMVLIACVVDLEATLQTVYHEDLVGAFRTGIRRGVVNVLGFAGDLDHFLDDAIKEGYADLQTTIEDAERVRAPVILFAAEQDTWVQLESVTKVQAALGTNLRHLYLIPEALHRLQENPEKMYAVFRQLVTGCLEDVTPLSEAGKIREASQREVRLQIRLERERSRAQHLMAKTETVEFWRDFLAHYHYIVNSPDYWHLLDQIYSLMGPCENGEIILDAGCGNGNFGMFLLINQAYRSKNISRGRFKPT